MIVLVWVRHNQGQQLTSDNEVVYNNRLMYYKHPRDTLWEEFWLMTKFEKEAYRKYRPPFYTVCWPIIEVNPNAGGGLTEDSQTFLTTRPLTHSQAPLPLPLRQFIT